MQLNRGVLFPALASHPRAQTLPEIPEFRAKLRYQCVQFQRHIEPAPNLIAVHMQAVALVFQVGEGFEADGHEHHYSAILYPTAILYAKVRKLLRSGHCQRLRSSPFLTRCRHKLQFLIACREGCISCIYKICSIGWPIRVGLTTQPVVCANASTRRDLRQPSRNNKPDSRESIHGSHDPHQSLQRSYLPLG